MSLIGFLLEYKDVIGIVVVGAIGFLTMGKKKAINTLLSLLEESKNILLANIEEDKEKHTQFIFNKLPKKARVFLTKKRISAILDEFIEASKK